MKRLESKIISVLTTVMRKNVKCIGILLIAAGLFSCEKRNLEYSDLSDETSDEGFVIETLTDDDFLSLAYDRTYFYPDGFYEDTASPDGFYYVNTVSISPINNRDLKWIELSTNDKKEALNWLNLTTSNMDERIETFLIHENETEKYFEFKCKSVTDGIFEYTQFYRVHKKNYYHSIFNGFAPWNHVNETKYGYYHGKTDKLKVKECIEYLWVINSFANYGQKVLRSEIKDTNDYFEAYICSLVLTYGDWGVHDEVSVYDNLIRFNKSSRLITFQQSLRKQITGTYRPGFGE